MTHGFDMECGIFSDAKIAGYEADLDLTRLRRVDGIIGVPAPDFDLDPGMGFAKSVRKPLRHGDKRLGAADYDFLLLCLSVEEPGSQQQSGEEQG